MAAGIILAGGTSRRMPGDKAFMELSGRRAIDIQLEAVSGLFEEVLIVGNRARMADLEVYSRPGVRVVEETVDGAGALGGLASGLELSGARENFVLACDMPFIKRDAVRYIMAGLTGYQVAVPVTDDGLEPLHAAYMDECLPFIERQLHQGVLKVTSFFDLVEVNYIPDSELKEFDPTGRLLLNINSPEDMRSAFEQEVE